MEEAMTGKTKCKTNKEQNIKQEVWKERVHKKSDNDIVKDALKSRLHICGWD